MANENLVETLPTKELFVNVLTRDIKLEDAVLDLVDNCIDGAKRLHPRKNERLDGRWVKISCDATEFRIEDNCGGISLDLARNYAFRFGRDKRMGATPNSIGQFGVGMKRALLRFGHAFTVSSTSDNDHFELFVDVDTWLTRDDWHFKFKSTRKRKPSEEPGTKIHVTRLTEDARSRFPLTEFRNSLQSQLEKNTQEYLNLGLVIELNGTAIIARPFEILFSDEIVPAKTEKVYFKKSPAPVSAEFIVGLGASSPSEAGWYISCNGRIIVSADQSKLTGWDTIADEGVPKYHNQFSRFRGYLAFSCVDAGRLPWNTMKTGVNPDAAVYQDARSEMIALMRPVIDFLNRVDKENEEDEEDRVLTKMLGAGETVGFTSAAKYASVFEVKAPPRKPKPATISIQFRRPKAEAEELVDAMGANSARNAAEVAWNEAVERYLDD
jgi:hypothetical protein